MLSIQGDRLLPQFSTIDVQPDAPLFHCQTVGALDPALVTIDTPRRPALAYPARTVSRRGPARPQVCPPCAVRQSAAQGCFHRRVAAVMERTVQVVSGQLFGALGGPALVACSLLQSEATSGR